MCTKMACDGRFTAAHGQMRRLHLNAYDHLTAKIAELDELVAELDELVAELDELVAELDELVAEAAAPLAA